MAQISLKTESTEVVIDVANTEFMQTWLDYMNSLTMPSFSCSRWFYYWKEISDKGVPASIDLLEDALLYCSKYITNYDWSNSLQALENFKQEPSQSHMNIIHRDFTSQILQKNIEKYLDNDLLSVKVHNINAAVHQLEVYKTWNLLPIREKFPGKIFAITFTDANNMEGVDFSPFKHKLTNLSFDHKKENTDYNVWLNEDILGKDLIRCFLDGDDPNNSDITGNTFMTPNLMIDVKKTNHEILQSPEFNEWHAAVCPDKNLNRWPVGNIDLTSYNLPEKDFEDVLEYKIYDKFVL